MQISGKNDIEKIKGFFKSSILIDDIMEIIKYKVDSLIGIDTISANILKKSGVNTIKDLAELPDDKILENKEITADILEKWISIAKVIQEFISSSRFSQKKVLLIGLDNGGKTSILNVVQDKYSMVKNILPTRGVQREQLDFFGFGVVSWDLGGQIQYRENLYFKRPELYFSEADLLLYVVDVQDPKRFVESANYLKIVLQVLEDLNEKPELLIILNKFDPDLKNDKTTLANAESAKTKFKNMVKDYGVESLDFVNTTIFESFT
ncbi:MAG: 50S ribosome-binding GTPase, partial [Candidatus Lokiarchaeota archaeon]|nr:50S ribosome-binding GTPase [Candidatus Lokiarchaeota archaeon]